MKKSVILLAFLLGITASFAQQGQDSLAVKTDDNTYVWYPVKISADKSQGGQVTAVYAHDTTVTAYVKNYYMGYQSGITRTFYPTGEKMELIVYQKGKKNGDYTYYGKDGQVKTKGEYRDDRKDGYWAYRSQNLYGSYRKGLKAKRWKWYYSGGRSYFSFRYNRKGELVKSNVAEQYADKVPLINE